MKLVLLLTILILTITALNAEPIGLRVFDSAVNITCPPGYTQPANSQWPMCYRVFQKYLTRSEAHKACREHNGTLASVPNAFVNSYLYSLAVEANLIDMHLGIECIDGDITTCINTDQTPFGYSNFRPGYPDLEGECIYMSITGKYKQQWDTFICTADDSFACETRALGVPIVPTTTTVVQTTTTDIPINCPHNYTGFHSMCYEFVHLGKHFGYSISAVNASLSCAQTPGGMLATVPNAEVQSFLTSFVPDEVTGVAFGLHCDHIQKSGDTTSCKWDDGTPFSYSAFGWGSPSLKDGYNSGCCDFAYLPNKWGDCFSCTDPTIFDSYICQAPPLQ